MKTEHFNLESITELGEFAFNFAGTAKGGGEFWGVFVGSRCLFHLRVNSQMEIENIYIRQKNYPYYSPTEKDHYFFFEDKIFHVNPALVDPLAEMIILYFSQMTRKLKPGVKNVRRQFNVSLDKFDSILKNKLETVKKPASSTLYGAGTSKTTGPLSPEEFTEPRISVSQTSPLQSISQQKSPAQPASPAQNTPVDPVKTVDPLLKALQSAPAQGEQKPPVRLPHAPEEAQPAPAPRPASLARAIQTSSSAAGQTPAAARPSEAAAQAPAAARLPEAAAQAPAAARPPEAAAQTPAAARPSEAAPGSDAEKDAKELQRERMRERRRRLGLPDDLPV